MIYLALLSALVWGLPSAEKAPVSTFTTESVFECRLHPFSIYPFSDGGFGIIGDLDPSRGLDERRLLTIINLSDESSLTLDYDQFGMVEELGLRDLDHLSLHSLGAVYRYEGQYLLKLMFVNERGKLFHRLALLDKEGRGLGEVSLPDGRPMPGFVSFSTIEGRLYGLYSEVMNPKYGVSYVWRDLNFEQKQGKASIRFESLPTFPNRSAYESIYAIWFYSWLVDVEGERVGIKQLDPSLHFFSGENRKLGVKGLELEGYEDFSHRGINKNQPKASFSELRYGFSKITGVAAVNKQILVAYEVPVSVSEKSFDLRLAIFNQDGGLVNMLSPVRNGLYAGVSESSVTVLTQSNDAKINVIVRDLK